MTGPAFRSTSSPTESVMSLSNLEQAMSRSSSGILPPPQKIRSRTQSISSDRPSTIGYGLMSPPLSVSPEAAFIAASAASQIVTNDHDSHADTWYDQLGIEPSGETALVSPAALQLVNNFLDQLLFNFLSISRSTTLSALRPAVSEVLKPKLAKDAINQADEELREYLGGGTDDDDEQEARSARDWDLELVWKRTRLRCMVYSSLGDMEEEDEDYYMEQENLDTGLGEAVPAAVSIFLTSILEFMGEAALVIAGQAAYHRIRDNYEKQVRKGDRSPADVAERIVVEDMDMERVALDRTLGRLWRAWKKKLRSPGSGAEGGLSRPHTRDSMRGLNGQHMRQASFTFNEAALPPTVPEPETEAEVEEPPIQEPIEEYLLAASIPLPMRDNDVDEIEVPGLCSFAEDGEDIESSAAIRSTPARPKSMMVFPHAVPTDPPTPTSPSHAPVMSSRKRSNSVPTLTISPMSPAKRQKVEATAAQLSGNPEKTDKADSRQMSTKDNMSQGARKQGTAQPSDAGGLAVAKLPAEGNPHKRNTSSVSVLIDTAAAVEVATVAGFKAQAKAEAEAEQDATGMEEDDEEPQVFTSSRVSISGQSASPTTSEPSKPSAVSLRPVRTLSVHSLRLIDVAGPRSPITRSRGSSVDATELMRSGNLSRTNSVSTTPIVEEYRTAMDPPPTIRASTSILSSESISEVEEFGAEDDGLSPMTQAEHHQVQDMSAPPLAKPRSPARLEQLASDVTSSQPIFGSARRRSPPSSSPRSTPAAAAKVAKSASSTNTNGGTFFFDQDRPEVPEKSPVQTRAPPPVQSPSVPARSPGREATNGGQQRGLKIQTASEATTIGVVSVQSQPQSQSRTRSTSTISSARTPDQSNTQLHTSTSSTSSANNRPNLKPARTSEESVPSSRADVARNFEELIQSDETIQYTLTPQSMRDDPFNGSPLVPVKSRKSEDAHKTGDRSRASSVNQANQQNGIKRSTSVSRATGLNSHPVAPAVSDAVVVTTRANGPVPRSVPPVPSNPRSNGPQARDARLPRESLADFADFIRSTGPPLPVAPPNGVNAFNRAAGQGAVRSSSGGPSPVAKASIDSNRTNPSRSRLQAREAAVDKNEDNSDLIDFIRRGPPNAVDNPRIPRTVAPFRTTMDSDQMTGAVGGRAVDAQIRDMNEVRGSQASTTITDYSMPSVQSSVNSQTGLLRTQHNTNGQSRPSYGGANVSNNSNSNGDNDMPIPKRKTRRVRDPYAIDLSDEDEDEDMLQNLEATPKASRRAQPKEESLADFLRNCAPPPEPARAPAESFSMAQMEKNVNRPKKKASAPSLMARFTSRRNSTTNPTSPGSPKMPPPPLPQSYSVTEYPRTLASRAGSVSSARTAGTGRHIPIQLNMPPGVDRYNPGYGAVPPSSSGAGSRPPVSLHNGSRVQMKRFEPREAVSVPSRGATSDLADFLRNSGPPPGAAAPDPYPPPQSDSRNGFFGRRKKASFA